MLSFAIIVMLVGCNSNRHTQIDVPVYTMPDLEWWRGNLEGSDANLSIGTSVHGGIATAEEIFSIMESIEFYDEISVKPIGGNDYLAHGISLTNWDEDKHISFTFYDDFAFVAINEKGTKVDQSPLYRYSDSEKVKQFFIDKGCYIAPHIRSEIVGRIDSLVMSGNQQLLNSLAQPATQNGETTFLPMMGKIKDVYVSNVFPVDNEEYYANVDLVYDCGTEKKGFMGLFVLNKEFELVKVLLTEDENLPLKINPYVIADTDYSIWMEKLDSPITNQFSYQLVGGGYGMGSSGMEWNTSIMRCINGLELGDMVDINTKYYPYQQTYSILLSESNPNYDVKPLIFSFYDDCQYVVICNCQDEVNWTVCEKHAQAYKVNNPETVREVFSMKGQYVPADDFKSLEKFADDYVRKTSVKKLNEMSVTDEKINESYELQGNITKMTARVKADTQGKEKYQIEFVAMYAGHLPNGNREFVAYKIEMIVVEKGDSWQIETMGMRKY